MNRRTFLAGITGAASLFAGCTGELHPTNLTVVNGTNDSIRTYVAVTEVTLVDAQSKEWNLELTADETRELSFSTGDANPRKVIVDPNGLESESIKVSDDESSVRVTLYDDRIEFAVSK